MTPKPVAPPIVQGCAAVVLLLAVTVGPVVAMVLRMESMYRVCGYVR